MVSDVHPDDAPRQEAEAIRRRRRREVILEEVLRASTALMAVVFAGGLITALPFVPVWLFGAALMAVALSLPTGIVVRVGGLRDHPEPHGARWARAFAGTSVVAVLGVLLLVMARVTTLETGLWRVSGVLAILALIAWVRGRALPDPDAQAARPDDEGDHP